MTDHSVIGAGGEEVGGVGGAERFRDRRKNRGDQDDIQEEGSLVTVQIPLEMNTSKT